MSSPEQKNASPAAPAAVLAVRDWLGVGQKAVKFLVVAAAGAVAGALLGEALLAMTRPATRPSQAVCLVIDCSGSMLMSDAKQGMKPHKLHEVKSVAEDFVVRQDLSRNPIAVIGFGSSSHCTAKLTRDKQSLLRAVESLADGGSTMMDLALTEAARELPADSPGSPVHRTILLFTDGQPDDQPTTLDVARKCREQGIRIVAVATGDADVNYLTQVTGERGLVFPTSSGQFHEAFQRAEAVIYGGSLVESATGSTLAVSMLRDGGWTALIAAGISLALLIGQNFYTHRPQVTPREGLLAFAGGLAAGAVAGAIGQLPYALATSVSRWPLVGAALGWLLSPLGRIVGWSIVGALVGRGLALVLPNLDAKRAWQGGAAGGLVAAVAFLFLSLLGDTAGRLLGAAVLGGFIGLAIVLVEAAYREFWLECRYGSRETISVNLGAKPVRIGSNSRVCNVYARDVRPLAFQYMLEDGQVYCLDYSTERRTPVAVGEEKVIGNITVTVRSKASATPPVASADASPGGLAPPPPVPQTPASSPAGSPAPAGAIPAYLMPSPGKPAPRPAPTAPASGGSVLPPPPRPGAAVAPAPAPASLPPAPIPPSVPASASPAVPAAPAAPVTPAVPQPLGPAPAPPGQVLSSPPQPRTASVRTVRPVPPPSDSP